VHKDAGVQIQSKSGIQIFLTNPDPKHCITTSMWGQIYVLGGGRYPRGGCSWSLPPSRTEAAAPHLRLTHTGGHQLQGLGVGAPVSRVHLQKFHLTLFIFFITVLVSGTGPFSTGSKPTLLFQTGFEPPKSSIRSSIHRYRYVVV